ncbi:RHS repeat-associated core domain-containing protein [Pseudosporangium ferrugineum]|nr:RHS repeat-associated core domain-containing protein [Pseudosporangium ferrugineum]
MTTIFGTSEFSYVADTDYNALGQIDKLDLYTGLYSKTGKHTFASYTHELETRRLTGIRTDREAISPYTVTDMQYTYDNAGNITRIKDAAAPGSPDYQCFGYDGLRRLGQAWTPASGDCTAAASTSTLGGPAKYWLSWKYDNVGNRTEELDRSTTTPRTTTYRYPAPGTPQPHALADTTTTVGTAPASTIAYGHDPAGNMTTRPKAGSPTQTLTWDSEGHVETITEGAATTSYLYDADGNRLISSDPAGKTLYLPGQEIRFTASTGARTGTRYYTFAGQTVASRNNSGLTWLTADRQGTAQTSLDPVSQQATIRRQTPFGGTRGAVPAWPNTKGFVGGTTDTTGLTHLGAREYDPQLGRFISVDPILDPADPQQWTGYSYANNSPVTLSDPTGLIPSDCREFDCYGYSPGKGCPGGCGTPENIEWGRNNGKTSTKPNSKRKRYSGRTPDGRRVPDKSRGERWTLQDYAEFRYNTSYADALANHLVQQDLCTDFGEMCGGLEEPTGISVSRMLEGGVALLTIAAGPEILAACAVAPMACAYGVADDAAAFYGSGSLVGGVGMGFAGKTSTAGRAGEACSFSGDTQVLLADGTSKKFEDLENGDLVLAKDPENGNEGGRLVEQVWVHIDDLYELSVDGKRLVTTEDHPYWNAEDRVWEPADELDDGDRLQASDGHRVRVGGLIRGSHRTALAYNLTVQDLHTYYVLAGKTPVLVHNFGCGGVGAKRGPKPSGTGPHNLKIEAVGRSVTDGEIIAGGGVLPERAIATPGGFKGSRRPDILVRRPDGSLYGINVGKQAASGAPIKREAQAVSDLEGAGIEMHFVPYN